MDPSLVSSLLEESQVTGYLRDRALHMQIKIGTKIKNPIAFISKQLEVGDCDQIFCWGLPGAIEKVVPFAEKVKSMWLAKMPASSSSPVLYQCTRLFLHSLEMRTEDYLVKARKPAMVIILSLRELVETDNLQTFSIIPMAEAEVPAIETPFPSRRKKRHQQKKKRQVEESASTSQSAKRPKKNRKLRSTKRNGGENNLSEECVFDSCPRLVMAKEMARAAVAKISNVKRSRHV